MDTMTAIEYQSHLQRLAMAAQLVSNTPIADLLYHITHVETVGPLLEPTAWIRGGADNLRDARDLVEAAAPFVRFGGQLEKKART